MIDDRQAREWTAWRGWFCCGKTEHGIGPCSLRDHRRRALRSHLEGRKVHDIFRIQLRNEEILPASPRVQSRVGSGEIVRIREAGHVHIPRCVNGKPSSGVSVQAAKKG